MKEKESEESSMERFFRVPKSLRDEYIRRARSDYEFLLVRGYNYKTMQVGSILPGGNRVAIDETGNKYFKAPDLQFGTSTPFNN